MNFYNITFSVNRSYLLFACVTLYSLLENNKHSFFNVYILHNNCLDNNEISSLCKKHPLNNFTNFKIHLVDVSKSFDFSQFQELKHWSVDIYSKIFLPNLLPQVDKILHLDADVLVLKDISELLNTNMHNVLYCGDNAVGINSNGNTWFNAGVSLHNLKLARELRVVDNLLEYIVKNNHTEELAINLLYKERIKFFPKSYILTTHVVDNFKEDFNLIKIIHFVNPKPWLLDRSKTNLKIKSIKPYYPYLEKFMQSKYKLHFKILTLYAFTLAPIISSYERRIIHLIEKVLKRKKSVVKSTLLTKMIYKYSIIGK